jgi:tetratricopeptide (TPR) repeat protein
MINRDTFIHLIDTAFLAGRADYAKHTANDWLAVWPGDLEVQLLIARAEMEQGQFREVIQRLNSVLSTDPECIQAYELLASSLRTIGEVVKSRIYEACAKSLRGEELNSQETPAWVIQVRLALKALARGDFQTAIPAAQVALTADPDLALPTLVALKASRAAGNPSAVSSLARTGLERWPNCVHFLLIIANDLLLEEKIDKGVAYIHQAVSHDTSGRIAKDVLGNDHPYRNLWPEEQSADLNRPIPADVAAVLGDNRLSSSASVEEKTVDCSPDIERGTSATISTMGDEPATKSESPAVDSLPEPEPWESFRGPNPGDPHESAEKAFSEESLIEIEQDFRRLAGRLKSRQRARDEDGRSPVYVVLSSHTRLQQSFGEDGYLRVNDAVLSLVEAIRRRPGWTAYRIYPDDPSTLDAFDISPCDPGNAWEIKLRIADLDQALAKRGEMIGALLIVGGNGIVPFHLLPNPTDDDDDVVPSDNPYAATDENYFAPEWPVGRIPFDQDLDELVTQLDRSTRDHRQTNRSMGLVQRLNLWLFRRFTRLFRSDKRVLGYTASIWRKASFSVFKTIGDPRAMITSPPTEANRLPSVAMGPARLSYYNLHGLEDAPEWYGQRDPLRDDSNLGEFPIALRPQDVVNSGRAPKVVFTEACYGANSMAKTPESALSLKFLSSGSRAIVGSTKISYGSITPPLIAADLLGRIFWLNLNQKLPVGEALRRAKLKLATEMHRRQGFLDGEDQKTLISFVLYGDPLFTPSDIAPMPGEKSVIRRTSRPKTMKTVCALGECEISPDKMKPSSLKKVKLIVSQYLPGMQDAACKIHPQHFQCSGEDHTCPTMQMGAKSQASSASGSTVITLSKHIPDGDRSHPHFARITLDATGKVTKLAVSR